MEARQAMYQFVTGLINLIWSLWPVVGPFVLMGVIIKIVRWAHSSARGEQDIDELRRDYEDATDPFRAGAMAAKREYDLRHVRDRDGFKRAYRDYYRGIRRARGR